jgi:G3E family GTPase
LSDPTLAGLYRIAAVIATVDAVNGPHTLNEHVESVRQVALADQIFITKLDLVDPAKAKADEDALAARLRRLNPAAKISSIDAQTFDIAAVLRSDALAAGGETDQVRAWLNAAAYEERDDHSHGHHDHHAHDHHHLHDRDIASFCFIREQPIPRDALRLLLEALQQNLGPNLLRVKGLINVAEEPERPAVIQGAQHLLHNLTFLERWPDSDRRSKIVFITQNFDRSEVEDMIALLDRVATRTAAARARAQAQTVANE